MLKIYGNPKSTSTRKVLLTLLEKDQPYDFVLIDFRKGEQKTPEHLLRQPFGVVPVLEEGNYSLYESRAIARYLDHKFGGVKLIPTNAEELGRMEQWISIEHSYFSGPAMQIIKQRYFVPLWGLTTDENIVQENIPKVEEVLDVAEKTLAKRPYFAGEQFTLAEINWMPYVEYLFSSGVESLIQSRPNIRKWWETISKRPTWVKIKG